MDGGYEFQLGVFANGFEPTQANAGLWLQFWTPAQTVSYNSTGQRFAGLYQVSDNNAPFTAGAKAWIFGYREGVADSEWILFRSGGWLWPALDPNPIFPIEVDWNAKDANTNSVVIGTIHPTGSPFLMQSAAVQSYAQWQTTDLTGEALDDPEDDPDLDGSSNLLEFVFGTDPKTANAPVATPVALDSGHVVITIPRRIDHLAVLTVEVSGNLVDWNSGDGFTEIIQDDASALVVRDLTSLGPANPKRFIRLKAVLPAP